MSKIWILTEERPKRRVINSILVYLHEKHKADFSNEAIKISPIIKDGKFAFRYSVSGIKSAISDEITIIPVSGKSSFVDFLVFVQDDEPKTTDTPVLVIEETKTDDKEARNMTYQRCTKFVYSKYFYPDAEQILLYSLSVEQKEVATPTYIFATRLLATYGVRILGKREDKEGLFKSFSNIDELIQAKNSMNPTANGVSVRLTKTSNRISITARLEKSGTLSSDPSIGTVSIISACLRKLGWEGEIVITSHMLNPAKPVPRQNKFNFVAKLMGITVEGINLLPPELPEEYWVVEKEKEKTASIFTHIICENLEYCREVYENHGGCERGYFYYYDDKLVAIPLAIPKYTDRQKYKLGNKEYIVYIPDLVLFDAKRNEVIDIEGKTYAKRANGVQELNNYDYFEEQYIKKYFGNAKIIRSLTLSGTGNIAIAKSLNETGLYLDNIGNIIVTEQAPEIIKDAYKSLSL